MSPRTSDQWEQLRDARKTQILDAALKVFASRGYDGASIQMIAKEAGMAKGLMYTYYDSKEHLVEELIHYGLQKAASFLEEMPPNEPKTKKAFEASLRHIIRLFREDSDFWRLYTMLALQTHLSAKFKKEAIDFLNQCLGMYVTYFQQKKSPDPMAEAMLFGAVLDGIMFDLMVAQDEYPLEAVIQMAVKKFA